MFDPAKEANQAFGDAAFCQRVARYLDGDVDTAELAVLNAELKADAAKQAAFVRLCLVRSVLISDGISDQAALAMPARSSDADALSHRAEAGVADDFGLDDDSGVSGQGARSTSLYDAMILPALREADRDDRGVSRRLPPRLPAVMTPNQRSWSIGPRGWAIGVAAGIAAAAAVVVITSMRAGVGPTAKPVLPRDLVAVAPTTQPALLPVAVVPPVPPVPVPPPVPVVPRPPAVISALAGAVFAGPGGPGPGTPLVPGQPLNLTGGAVEITFDSGAVVVASAPARMWVVDRGLLHLDAGSVAAHVPPAAIGFRVDAPDLSVVDRGTDFGVRTDPAGDGHGAGSLLSVFKGAVDATTVVLDPPTTAPAVAQPMRVTAGHAVAHAAGDRQPPRETTYEPAAFVRTIDSYRIPIAMHGTGAAVAFEHRDPYWRMTAGPAGTGTYPKPAYAVALPLSLFTHTTPAAKWISTAPKKSDVPGGNFTFHTTVSLPDFAPQTLSITTDWAADDWISDIVVNGVGTASANASVVGQASRMQPLAWNLGGAPWHAGDNEIDVIVWNKVAGNMALKLSWTATLCPVVRR